MLNWPLVAGTLAAPSTSMPRKAGALGSRVMVEPMPSKVIGGSPTGPAGPLPWALVSRYVQNGSSSKVSPPAAFAVAMASTSELSLHSTGVWACAVAGKAVRPTVRTPAPTREHKVRTHRMTPPGERWREPPYQPAPAYDAGW